jgi:hypothetical protein
LIALLAITAAGAIVRFATLGVQSFGEDESATVFLLRGTFHQMLHGVKVGESTPPLYYLLAWEWTRVFGLSEVAVRSLSALLGTLTIPAAAAVGLRLGGRRVALLVAALVATSPFLFWYSQESRAYPLLVLTTTLGLWCFVEALRDPKRRWLAGWAVASALAIASHYFAVFIIAAEAIWLARALGRSRTIVTAIALPTVVAAVLVPLVWAQTHPPGEQFIGEKVNIFGGSVLNRAIRLPRELSLGYAAPVGKPLSFIVLAVLLAGAVVALRRGPRWSRRTSRALLAVSLLSIAIPVAAAFTGRSLDFLVTRNFSAALIPVLAAAAVGLAATRAGYAAAATVCAIGAFVIGAVVVDGRYQRADYRDAVHAAGPPAVPRLLLVTRPQSATPVDLYASSGAIAKIFTGHRPAAVQEIDVLGIPTSGKNVPPPRSDFKPPAPSFVLVEARRTASWSLARYRAPTPQTVTLPAVLASQPVLRGGSAVIEWPIPPGLRPRQ